jgi:hypothetical protein
VKHTKRRTSRRLVTRRLVYKNHKRPHDRPQELKVDVPRDEVIDTDYAAAMVAARTTTPLADVKIIKIAE